MPQNFFQIVQVVHLTIILNDFFSGVPADRVILYGQSIGTVPSVDLASREEVAALILHSPLMSGMRVAFPGTQRTWYTNCFLPYGRCIPCD